MILRLTAAGELELGLLPGRPEDAVGLHVVVVFLAVASLLGHVVLLLLVSGLRLTLRPALNFGLAGVRVIAAAFGGRLVQPLVPSPGRVGGLLLLSRAQLLLQLPASLRSAPSGGALFVHVHLAGGGGTEVDRARLDHLRHGGGAAGAGGGGATGLLGFGDGGAAGGGGVLVLLRVAGQPGFLQLVVVAGLSAARRG